MNKFGTRLAFSAIAGLLFTTTAFGASITAALILYEAPSGANTVADPYSLGIPVTGPAQMTVGANVYLELWVTTDWANGLTGVGMDVMYDPVFFSTSTSQVSLNPSWGLLAYCPVSQECVTAPGLVDDIGGNNLTGIPEGVLWERIATIEFDVLSTPSTCTEFRGGQDGPILFAYYGGGLAGPSDITFINWEMFKTSESPLAEPGDVQKNRFLSFKVPVSIAGQETAIRVKLVDLYVDSTEDPVNGCPARTEGNDLSLFNGKVRYLGPPSAFDDNAASMPKFNASELQCNPYYRDWSPTALTTEFGAGVDTSIIYFYGAEVVPCSVYEVQLIDICCAETLDEGCFSDALQVKTALWGDVWAPFGQVDFTDIGKIVDAFKSIPFVEGPPPGGAPKKAGSVLRGNVPSPGSAINFTDIGRVVNAFKTIAYAEDGPTACP